MGRLSDDAKRQNAAFKRLVSQRLPAKVMREADKLVHESFQKEQYQDGKANKWKGRKNDPDSKKKRNDRRALLVDSGNLISSHSVIQRGPDIIISNDAGYAEVHNEGLKAGRGAGFQMPQRQFMPAPGEPFPKEQEIEQWLDDELDKLFT